MGSFSETPNEMVESNDESDEANDQGSDGDPMTDRNILEDVGEVSNALTAGSTEKTNKADEADVKPPHVSIFGGKNIFKHPGMSAIETRKSLNVEVNAMDPPPGDVKTE